MTARQASGPGPWPFVSLIVIAGVFAWAISATPAPTTSGAGDGSERQSVEQGSTESLLVGPLSTISAHLTLPTPTATSTPTPRPTSTQQVVWQPDPCSTPEPGQLCRVPDRAPPTPTPYPSCYDELMPGAWCRWIVADDAPDARQEIR